MRKYKYGILLLLIVQIVLMAVVYRQNEMLLVLQRGQQELFTSLNDSPQLNQGVTSVPDDATCIESRFADDCETLQPPPQNEAVVSLDSEQEWRSGMREKIMAQLLPFGFSAYDSERIIDIELKSLEAYRAIEEGDGTNARQEAHSLMWQTMDTMREELGEFGYQAYLEAKGLPLRIEVRNVSKRSQAAGLALRAGDEIERYDGVRVYDVFRLNQLVRDRSVSIQQGSVPLVYRRGDITLTGEVSVGSIGIHAVPLRPRAFFDAFGG